MVALDVDDVGCDPLFGTVVNVTRSGTTWWSRIRCRNGVENDPVRLAKLVCFWIGYEHKGLDELSSRWMSQQDIDMCQGLLRTTLWRRDHERVVQE